MNASRTRRRTGPAQMPPLVAVLCASLVLLACDADEPLGDQDAVVVAEPAAPEEAPPDQVLFDAVIRETESGDPRWVLRSDRLEKDRNSDEAELFGVHMDFFRADTLHSTLTSRRGKAHLKRKDLHAWEDVVVITRDGRRLETEDLWYSNETGLITNEVFNRFTRDEDVMTGTGLEATPDLEYFELKHDVEAEVVDEEGES